MMLTKAEQREAKKFAAGVWALLRKDSVTGVETWVQKEPLTGSSGYKLNVIETQPNTPAILDHNARIKDAQGADWTKREHGAIVASVPITIDNELKRQCGWDGFQYDREKYRKLLNDRDFRKLRTVDGNY